MTRLLAQAAHIIAQAARGSLSILKQRGRDLIVLVAVAIALEILARVANAQVSSGLLRSVIAVGTKIAFVWLCGPYLVALFRFALRGEQLPAESLRNTKAAIATSLWLSMLIILIELVPMAYDVMATRGGKYVDFSVSLGSLVVRVAVICIAIRLVLGVPAAALGRTLSFQQAFEESKGTFWLGLVALITPVAVAGILNLGLGYLLLVGRSEAMAPVVSVLGSYAVAGCLALICLAATAQLYLVIEAARTNRAGFVAH